MEWLLAIGYALRLLFARRFMGGRSEAVIDYVLVSLERVALVLGICARWRLLLQRHLISRPSLIIVHVRILVRIVGVRFLRSLAEAMMVDRISWVSEALFGRSLGSIQEFLGHQVWLGLIVLLHRVHLVCYRWSIVLVMRAMTGKANG